jgi:4-amino-4-deoxy-L-arabinose transferase-like glycosyltransferase
MACAQSAGCAFATPVPAFIRFSDYSIPLTFLYWIEARVFGLSEPRMRWPMMLASLLTLILFPVWVSRHLGWRVALVFALLLAISPLLSNYSRNARPYVLDCIVVTPESRPGIARAH